MPYRDLKAEQFRTYPTLARKTALANIELFQALPPGFLPFLLKETVTLDWKFPAEQQDLFEQLTYLSKLAPADRDREMSAFASLRLSPALDSFDVIDNPAQFIERLSAHLWATGQMDAFRSASEQYMRAFRATHPEPAPPMPRLAIVLVGQDVGTSRYVLFRKLRREGTLFTKVDGANGVEHAIRFLETRAAGDSSRYAHWLIDGGHTESVGKMPLPYTLVSYPQLADVRGALNARIKRAFETRMSPEALRSELAATTPQSLGVHLPASDDCMDRFTVSLFTEGSGTQIYSTTFVQWTAREALRRAKPLTLLARYAPRRRETSMAELLDGSGRLENDPAGSLIDADMGAWYTWISLQRLTGADQSRFVAWFEGHNLAVAVGPRFPKGTEDSKAVTLDELLHRA